MPAVYRTTPVVVAMLLVVTAHHAVSIFNLFSILPGADGDANMFYKNALRALHDQNYPDVTVGTGFYEWILFFTHYTFGQSKLVGQTLSIHFSAISLILMTLIASVYKLPPRKAVVLIVIVGLLPTHLFFTSITFREVFQLTGLAGGCAFAILAIETGKTKFWLFSIPFFLFMGLFHHVLIALGALLVGLGICLHIFRYSPNTGKALLYSLLMLFLVGVIGFFLVVKMPATSGNDYVEMLTDHSSINHFIFGYREAVDSANPRTSYGFMVETFEWYPAVVGLSKSYFYYVGGPWLSEIEKWIDYVPFINSIIRLSLMLFLILLFIRGKLSYESGIFLALFLLITFMWSLGSTNYGQSFRHNVMSDWLIVLATLLRLNSGKRETQIQ